ncbi:MAG TPA: thiamine pyrophosphate-binding protein [Thermoanaerobaculia bacterium]|jgi:2-succinyl-5-enolpyruvyl-6-hydroxy-3-cyclohexene-1-carboxylate synthase
MTNIELARRTIAAIRSHGVTDFCVCAGSRNAPLLAVLAKTEQIKIYTFVDERSAAFFALGVGKRHGRPACVVTTSGTAVAELLPAAIEAHYSGVPLVLLTADRPARFRGTGAPQSIDQQAIFGVHAATRIDDWDGRSALHMNVEFDEPLIDGDA